MHDAGAIHQDANRQAQCHLSALHACFDVVALGDVSRDAYRSNAMLALQRRGQGFDAVGAAGSAADGSACGSKCFRYGFADAA